MWGQGATTFVGRPAASSHLSASGFLTLVAAIVAGAERTITGIENVLIRAGRPERRDPARLFRLAVGGGLLLFAPPSVAQVPVLLSIGLALIVTEVAGTAIRFHQMARSLAA